jgi:ribosomal protein L35
MKSHLLEKKSPKRKRAFGKDDSLAPGDARIVSKLLGRG